MSHRVDYRGFQIICAMLKGLNSAQVYKGKTRIGSERFTDPCADTIVQEAKAWIDRKMQQTIEKRRQSGAGTSRAFQVGTVEEYLSFFESVSLPDSHRAMLAGHAAAPDRTLSASEIAACAGWASFSAANLQYGLLGAKVGAALELNLPRRADGSEVSTCAIATSADPNWEMDGNFRWTMHEEVAEALHRCNMMGQRTRR